MACNCGNKYHQPGCIEFLQSAPYCTNPCDDPTPCDQIISTDCVIYTGPDVPCYGLVTGMSLTEVLNILFQIAYPQCTTTTTTSTTTTTTANPSTTTTTTALPTTSTTSTTSTSTTSTSTSSTSTTSTTSSTTTTTTLNPSDCVCYSIQNPTLIEEGAVVIPCGSTDPLEVIVPAETTIFWCVVNGTVPYEQAGSDLIITPCGTSCIVDDLCENCGITTTTTSI